MVYGYNNTGLGESGFTVEYVERGVYSGLLFINYSPLFRMNNYKNLLLPHPVRGKEKWAVRKPGSARVVTGDKALKTTPRVVLGEGEEGLFRETENAPFLHLLIQVACRTGLYFLSARRPPSILLASNSLSFREQQ